LQALREQNQLLKVRNTKNWLDWPNSCCWWSRPCLQDTHPTAAGTAASLLQASADAAALLQAAKPSYWETAIHPTAVATSSLSVSVPLRAQSTLLLSRLLLRAQSTLMLEQMQLARVLIAENLQVSLCRGSGLAAAADCDSWHAGCLLRLLLRLWCMLSRTPVCELALLVCAVSAEAASVAACCIINTLPA
jgi:hypothetical protein